jgi:RNA polymerase sigma factor (sigma-70 family)
MFWVKSKKLAGEDLVNAVKKLQSKDSNRREKNEAFEDLRDTFKGLIEKKIRAVNEVASNKSERDEIRHHVETSFLEVLMDLTPKSPGEIVGYISKAFNTKINRHSIEILLGKGDIMSDIHKYKIRFKNALRTFHDKYKHMPDFNKIDHETEKSEDLEKFAEIMNTTEDKVLEILKLFGQGTIKSMYQEVAGDDEENALVLMDTLKSDEPLPDEVLRDKELTRILIDEIKKLPENQQKVLMLYYHPHDPSAEELTNNEIAAKTGITERNVRHWIAIGREKLRESPILKELIASALTRKLVKFAMNKYRTSEDLIFEVVASCQ